MSHSHCTETTDAQRDAAGPVDLSVGQRPAPRLRRRRTSSENLTAVQLRELTADAERRIDSIDSSSLAGLRNRAVLGVLGYAWASLDAALRMQVRDYYRIGEQRWVRFTENGVERHELVNSRLQIMLDEYIAAACIVAEPHSPLFRSTLKNSAVDRRGLSRNRVSRLLKDFDDKRLRFADLSGGVPRQFR